VDRRAVALGGGHGLAATLTALRALRDVGAVDEVTAIVTVADNGGSSGRLRGEFGVLPPGDLRMALAALCADDEWGQTWAEVIQHRFAGDGDLRGHALGNLLIVSLWELMGDHVRALDWVGRLLGSQGRVLPMAITPMDIRARVRGADPAAPDQVVDVRGQVAVAGTDGLIESVSLEPADPAACPEAVQAVLDAQWVEITKPCCRKRRPRHHVAFRRCAAHRQRQDRGRGGVRHRCGGPTAADEPVGDLRTAGRLRRGAQGGPAQGTRYMVRVVNGGEQLARQAGLWTLRVVRCVGCRRTS
jgi:hypothetical protein